MQARVETALQELKAKEQDATQRCEERLQELQIKVRAAGAPWVCEVVPHPLLHWRADAGVADVPGLSARDKIMNFRLFLLPIRSGA